MASLADTLFKAAKSGVAYVACKCKQCQKHFSFILSLAEMRNFYNSPFPLPVWKDFLDISKVKDEKGRDIFPHYPTISKSR